VITETDALIYIQTIVEGKRASVAQMLAECGDFATYAEEALARNDKACVIACLGAIKLLTGMR